MKKLKLILSLIVFPVLFTATQCEDDFNAPTYEEEKADLDSYKETIEDLAASSVCNEASECLFIGFGSKPCGGPWSYLVYSTSIDIEKLQLWVTDYNQQEQELNERWSLVSDCSVAIEPSGFTCEGNQCIPFF